MSLNPTFYGYVATTNDALLIFEAARRNRILQKVYRCPRDRDQSRLIKSGNIFVFDEQESGIRRWVDGIAWFPPRILSNYLIYRELAQPLQPGEKKRAQKRRVSNTGQRAEPENPELDNSNILKSGISAGQSPRPREAGGPIRSHQEYIKSNSASHVTGKLQPWTEEQEKELAGSLTDSYGFKEVGLIKKTISVEYEGTVHHLVSYYTIDDVMLSRLPTPSQDPRLADLVIGIDLLTRTNFRLHPSVRTSNVPVTASLFPPANAPVTVPSKLSNEVTEVSSNQRSRTLVNFLQMECATQMQKSKVKLECQVKNYFHWTTGNDSSVAHQCRIDSGAFGDVYQVSLPVFS